MSSTPSPVSVSILDREFLVACSDEERPGVIAAAAYLDAKMRELKNAARITGLDRIAVLAALNITHELMTLREQGTHQASSVAQHVQALKHKLEGVLSASVK